MECWSPTGPAPIDPRPPWRVAQTIPLSRVSASGSWSLADVLASLGAHFLHVTRFFAITQRLRAVVWIPIKSSLCGGGPRYESGIFPRSRNGE
jgi:hypothetical protein